MTGRGGSVPTKSCKHCSLRAGPGWRVGVRCCAPLRPPPRPLHHQQLTGAAGDASAHARTPMHACTPPCPPRTHACAAAVDRTVTSDASVALLAEFMGFKEEAEELIKKVGAHPQLGGRSGAHCNGHKYLACRPCGVSQR